MTEKKETAKSRTSRLFQIAKNAKSKTAAEAEKAKKEADARKDAEDAKRQKEFERQQKFQSKKKHNGSRRSEEIGTGGFAEAPLGAGSVRPVSSLHNRFLDMSKTTVLNSYSDVASQLDSKSTLEQAPEKNTSDEESSEDGDNVQIQESNLPVIFDIPVFKNMDTVDKMDVVPDSSEEEPAVASGAEIKCEDDSSSVDLLEESNETGLRGISAADRTKLFGSLAPLLANDSDSPFFIQLPLTLPISEPANSTPASSIPSANDPVVSPNFDISLADDSSPMYVKLEEGERLDSPASTTVLSSVPASTPINAYADFPGNWQTGTPSSSGAAGHIEFYDDGSTILKLGEAHFHVFSGVSTRILQHLVYIDEKTSTVSFSAPFKSDCEGKVSNKMICIPIM